MRLARLEWAAHSANYPLWHYLANTGERRGEALSARWRDLDAGARVVQGAPVGRHGALRRRGRAAVRVHVVSERLGHATPTVTLGVYAHVMPGNQRDAAELFARLIREAGA